MNDKLKIEICRTDFRIMMEEAFKQAGGNPGGVYDMKMRDFIDIVAQNGIRLVYFPEKNVDSLSVIWKKSIN